MKIKSGIRLISETAGTGRAAARGDTLTVRLNGRLNQGDPIQENHVCDVILGERSVIAGIEYSLEGMKPGGKRKVRISPHLAYRDRGVPGLIPPDSVLIYDIEVLGVKMKTSLPA